jgi:pantoate--beta-alanine ligase
VLFTPDASELYYKDAVTYVNVEKLTEGLCGAKRPGHFQGVCTVLTKFFNIVKPDRAYFGEKDAQQLAVVKRMARDLNFDTQIIGCPIVREKDGLAKSSRNTYLSAEERVAALVLFRSLMHAKEYILSKDSVTVQEIKTLITMEIMKSLWPGSIMLKSWTAKSSGSTGDEKISSHSPGCFLRQNETY